MGFFRKKPKSDCPLTAREEQLLSRINELEDLHPHLPRLLALQEPRPGKGVGCEHRGGRGVIAATGFQTQPVYSPRKMFGEKRPIHGGEAAGKVLGLPERYDFSESKYGPLRASFESISAA